MHIFIDEAGPFVIPSGREWAISCIGSLVIRDHDIKNIFFGFEQIKGSWNVGIEEIKGSNLNEQQVATVIQFLSQFDVIFEVTAIDMVRQTNSGITKHRLSQADKLVESLTDNYHENVKRAYHDLRDQMRNLSNQLYVQTTCSFELLYKTIQQATLYYVQRYPEELGEFYWEIDAKDKEITPYENMWQKIILPILQSKSLQEPFIQLSGADYSYFEKHKMEFPQYLATAIEGPKPSQCISIKDIYKKHFKFERSHESLGLQIVDILITNIRRAMNGNLQYNGWAEIGRLMVQVKKNSKKSQVIQIIDLIGGQRINHKEKKPPYWHVVPLVEKTCKPMMYK